MKEKLAIVLPSARVGGAEKVMLGMLQKLSREAFELSLILIENSGPFLDLIPDDVKFYPLGYDRVGKAMLKLALLLRSVRPNVVISSIGHLNLALLLIRPFLPKRTKVVVRESNMPSQSFASGTKFSFFRMLYPLLYPRADLIVCPGRTIKDELKRRFRIRAEKMVIIPNPVVVDVIRSEMLTQNPLKQNRINLVAAGSLTWQKGFDRLIEAMKKVAKTRTGVHLTIIGEGPEKANLRTQIRSMHLEDSITLAGYQANPYPFFYHGDLFVLTSRWEGLPNVVLESLACGTPVIAFDCPGGVNEIIDDPSLGALVPEGDVDRLVTAIDHFLQKRKPSSKDSLLPDRYDMKLVITQFQQTLLE